MLNKFCLERRKGRMCNYNFEFNPKGRILDLGTGTGVWANCMSEYVDTCIARWTIVSALSVDDADIY